MINHESKILELITRNGPLKVRDLCKLTGLHETSVKRFIKPLFTRGTLKRASDWSYSINTARYRLRARNTPTWRSRLQNWRAKGSGCVQHGYGVKQCWLPSSMHHATKPKRTATAVQQRVP